MVEGPRQLSQMLEFRYVAALVLLTCFETVVNRIDAVIASVMLSLIFVLILLLLFLPSL